MPFQKGQSGNPKGRTPIAQGGKPNKLYGTRKYIHNLLENNRDKLEKELNSLEGKEYCIQYIKLMTFLLAPRNSQVIDISQLSTKEIEDIIEGIN
tara:strand:- start:1425 stop:1709 length:285 start_codon:yes stop_codon:yes gene_type:complete